MYEIDEWVFLESGHEMKYYLGPMPIRYNPTKFRKPAKNRRKDKQRITQNSFFTER